MKILNNQKKEVIRSDVKLSTNHPSFSPQNFIPNRLIKIEIPYPISLFPLPSSLFHSFPLFSFLQTKYYFRPYLGGDKGDSQERRDFLFSIGFSLFGWQNFTGSQVPFQFKFLLFEEFRFLIDE